MDREGFLEVLRRQYADDIQEAFYESEHQEPWHLDLAALSKRLRALMTHAEVEGLTQEDFQMLVRSALPDLFANLTNRWKPRAKKQKKTAVKRVA